MPRNKRKRTSSSHQHEDDEFNRCLSDELKAKVELLFKKKFAFEKKDEWKLPVAGSSTCSWKVEELQSMKNELNTVKDRLSLMEINKWHSHTQRTNLAGGVISHVQATVRPELCTQAWCKFQEILCMFDLIPQDNPVFNTLHLCEAPGAFVTSLNHYLKTRGISSEWNWLANTLNPYYEGSSLSSMIADDRLILNTPRQWYFGPSDVGDITDIEVYNGLISQIKHIGPIHLVTADGSVDCQNNPAEQESIVSQLHYCELTTALSVLQDGGHFVLKMFTLYESQTVCIMYILNCLFKQVNVFKPATSKPGNSEVYVICNVFTGTKEFVTLLPTLKDFFVHDLCSDASTIFSRDSIQSSYLSQHIECCSKFKEYQQNTILNNIELFNDMSPATNENLDHLRLYCAQFYTKHCNLRTLPSTLRLVRRFYVKPHIKQCSEPNKRLQGSYHERQSLMTLPWKQRVELWEPLDIVDKIIWLETDWYQLSDDNLNSWEPVIGQKAERVLNSRFCSSFTLEDYNDKLDCCQVLKDGGFLKGLYAESLSEEDVYDNLKRMHLCEVERSHVHVVNTTKDNCLNGGEIKTKRELINGIITSLKSCSEGDCISVVLYDVLTRFTAGLVYLLHLCFNKITLRPVGVDGVRLLLVCIEYNGCQDSVMSYLDRVHDMSGASDIQQVVPMTEIYDAENFMAFLTQVNEQILQTRIDFFMKKEKELYSLLASRAKEINCTSAS